MKQVNLTTNEQRALIILDEYLRVGQVDGSHGFMDYLPMIEASLRRITDRLITRSTHEGTAA